MNTAARLGLYGIGLVVAFFAAYVIAGAVVPDAFVADWIQQAHTVTH
ncbi:hypothetical protein FM113_10065 [Leucobacter sp. 7(1)]|nr:hypothetical protein [Leucobacter sp. 7(1)]SJN10772.1 hypothetical protein FM113_10065 [Leucobacter sp. 7(1)]